MKTTFAVGGKPEKKPRSQIEIDKSQPTSSRVEEVEGVTDDHYAYLTPVNEIRFSLLTVNNSKEDNVIVGKGN